MATRDINTTNKRFSIRVWWKLFIYKFRKNVLRKKYLSYKEYKEQYKRKSKNELIDELVREAAKFNKKGFPYVEPTYRKTLRENSKSKLISALLKIKLGNQFGVPTF